MVGKIRVASTPKAFSDQLYWLPEEEQKFDFKESAALYKFFRRA